MSCVAAPPRDYVVQHAVVPDSFIRLAQIASACKCPVSNATLCLPTLACAYRFPSRGSSGALGNWDHSEER